MRSIFLYGPPGSGKSTVGQLLASALELPFLDLDADIEAAAGRSIPEIMAGEGEPAFRDLETAALEKAAAGPPAVIALGGGALLRDANRQCAEAGGEVVLLRADLRTLVARLQEDAVQRPLLAGDLEEKLGSLLEQRKAHYESFRLRVATDINPPGMIAWEIQRKLGRYRVKGMGCGYDVLVQPGGLAAVGELLRERGLGGPVALVSDSNVAALHADPVLKSLGEAGCEVRLTIIPAGEENKNLDTVSVLWQAFLESGLDRKSTVVALGGGMTGDLAGFAAATFMRGVDWVCLPTSLLAMADASLGGKTGFDLPAGKNLVGAFHPPRLVLSDPQVLSTLPQEEFSCGLAEVVKNGIVCDPELFALCARGLDPVRDGLAEVVRRAMAAKIQVIEADPFERGIRAALNLGHTVGHAVETASHYDVRHGEAVAIGMALEARLAERLKVARSGLAEEIGVVLAGLGLPIRIPASLSRQDVLKAMRVDKKKADGVVRFALPVKIGEVRTGVAVDDLELVFE